ncbi:zinc ribbon domain-containing protein [Conexibacter woesei]|nr:zinc ribbon domain-containing protein [Conexibacter woesei]
MSQTTACRTCGASLAPDQRYCLSCGTRVAAPRLDFLAESGRAEVETQGDSAASSTPGAAAPAPSRLDKIGGPMGAAAVVLVALGVGFLVGQARDDAPPAAQKAPVVTIESGLQNGGATTPASDPPADGRSEATSTR